MFDKKKILLILGFLISFIMCATFELSAIEKKSIILIDPAHGGKDQGIKLTNDVAEKDVALTVALSIKKELSSEKNIEIILTRDSDKTVDLAERKKIIEKVKPHFLISLHVNGGFGKNASGFEIYYPEYGENKINENKKTKDDAQQLKNKCQNDSLGMAKIVQENLNVLFPRKGRGLRKADLPIIEGLAIPALTVEMSFATNAEDKKKLLTLKTQTDISKALAKSVKTFFR